MSVRSAASSEFLAEDMSLGGADTYSVIDRHSAFDGSFRSDRDLRIEGEVKGTIECQGTLFVAQGATVNAKVEAENITVAGDLSGEIRCRGRLQMMPSGRVRGTVSTVSLVINEGAYYEGQLEMVAPENRDKALPRSKAGATGPVPVPLPQASDARGGNSGGNATTFIRRLGSPETPWESESGKEESGDTGDRDE